MKIKRQKSKSIYQEMIEILILFTKAVRKAQAENRKLGLPNVFCDGERVFYQLPDGRITLRIPRNLLRNSSFMRK